MISLHYQNLVSFFKEQFIVILFCFKQIWIYRMYLFVTNSKIQKKNQKNIECNVSKLQDKDLNKKDASDKKIRSNLISDESNEAMKYFEHAFPRILLSLSFIVEF